MLVVLVRRKRKREREMTPLVVPFYPNKQVWGYLKVDRGNITHHPLQVS